MKTRSLTVVFAAALGLAPLGRSADEGSESDPALTKAYQFESAHEWVKARAEYDQLLARQPAHAAAKDGRRRVSEVIVAELQFERLIAEAERLARDAKFQSAIRAFNQAANVKPAYLEMSERVSELRKLLLTQSGPVEVTMKSDGHTWVTIENYRAPRQLQGETVKMLPGNYRVVGRRQGYAEVEQMLSVRAGTAPQIDIMCTTSLSSPTPDALKEASVRFAREYQQQLAVARAEEAQAQAQLEDDLAAIRHRYLP